MVRERKNSNYKTFCMKITWRKNIYRPYFIVIYNSSLAFTIRNEEELVALLVYSSFERVAISGFRIIPYSLVVVVVCAQLRSDSRITPYSPQNGIVRVVLVTSSD